MSLKTTPKMAYDIVCEVAQRIAFNTLAERIRAEKRQQRNTSSGGGGGGGGGSGGSSLRASTSVVANLKRAHAETNGGGGGIVLTPAPDYVNITDPATEKKRSKSICGL